MSQLIDNLNAIYNEKQSKLLPENIKKGVQIFDITGTYEVENTSNTAYVTSGLVSHYKLESDTNDTLGYANATNQGLTFTYDNVLAKNVAVGGNGYATFSNGMTTTYMTLSILAKSSGNTDAYNFLFSLASDNTASSDNALSLVVHNGKLAIDVSYTTLDTNFDFNDGKWHRYTVTLGNAHQIFVYVDDKRVLDVSHSTYPGSVGRIGAWTESLGFYFNGCLSNALVYDRCLSLDEIQQNYEYDLKQIAYLQELTSDATAGADDILKGKTAYVNGEKVTGTLEINTDVFNKDYQEVEFIQSTGTQYIDTKILASNSIKFEGEFSDVSINDTALVIGTSVWAENSYILSLFTEAFRWWLTGTSTPTTFGTNDFTNKHKISIYRNTVYFDDTLINEDNTERTINNPSNICIFGNNISGRCNAFKLYGFKIWNDEILVRNFIPCYRKTDGIAGLYDTVNDVFYVNDGTGEFTIGPNVENEKDSSGKFFTELSYIESTGTQYIDTGIIPSNHTVEMQFQYTVANNDTALFGEDSFKYHMTWYNNKWYYYCGGTAEYNVEATNCTELQTVVFNNKNNQIEFNGVEYGSTNDGTTSASTNLYLFCRRWGGADNRHSSARIYYCKIYDKNTNKLVRNFVPVRSNVTNELGLFDLVEQKFYKNLGTDEFLAGTEILSTDTTHIMNFEKKYQCVEFIESSGTQYINTGVLPQAGVSSACVEFEMLKVTTGKEQWALGQWYGSNGWRCGYQYVNSAVAWDTSRGFSYNTTGLNTRMVGMSTTCPITSSYPMILFAQQEQGNITYKETSFLRLYGCKIWESGVPVRDFIPCYRKSDGVAGLYDVINDVFYTNDGTGEFIIGPEIGPYISLEYIERSDNTQYIDTGVKALSTIGVELTVQTTTTDTAAYFGAWENGTGLLFGQHNGYHNPEEKGYYVATKTSWQYTGVPYDHTIFHKFIYDPINSVVTVDDHTISVEKNGGCSLNMWLFQAYEWSEKVSGVRVARCKIYDNGVLIRDYIPVLRKSDNIACMYDLVNAEFVLPSSGEFIAGPQKY